MKIEIRKLYCCLDEDGFWQENEGRHVGEFHLPEESDDETIKDEVVARLRDNHLNPLAIAAGEYKWSNWGDDLEILDKNSDEPLFHVAITKEN